MSNPFSLESVLRRLISESIGPEQVRRLAWAISGCLQEVWEQRFPGVDCDDWCKSLSESLLDVIIQLLAWSEDGRIVVDRPPVAAVGHIFTDLKSFSVPAG
ncbi:hypothetical protein [Streptomyces ipomoeae]|uniref:hypothetical protein n=1 Tax=Streptomyces ipomoeae TaxID=103232 RepID=UPI0029B84845|nr:hypothetical protein [Streptomyces ipomoeae]MDX2878439.1 hypothetical protein [Streptomyces ipomoeae]